MLPGYVAGHYDHDQCHIDLVPLARLAGATLVHASAVKIDLDKKSVHVKSYYNNAGLGDERKDSKESLFCMPPIEYDVLSINVGITPDTTSVPGAEQYTTTVKPIDRFVSRFDELLVAGSLDGGGKSEKPRRMRDLEDATIALVGGGAGGTELCLALHHRLSTVEKIRGLQIVLYTRGVILSSQNTYARRAMRDIFKRRNIRLVENAHVLEVLEGKLRFEDSKKAVVEESFDHCLWCTNASPASWLKNSGLEVDSKGFVLVNEYLQSVSHPDVFAAGDCATIRGHPRPKAGVFAVRQGAPLMENISRKLQGGLNLRNYTPQVKYLSLISVGNKYAVGLRGGFGFQGEWVWKLKNWIDTKWMAKYTTEVRDSLLMMTNQNAKAGEGEAEKRHKMFCAGCGSKVGPDVLSSVLQLLKESEYSSVTSELDHADDAAILDLKGSSTKVAHSVDFFRSFIEDPFVFGAIAANHALSDIYAMGARPKSALAIAVVPHGSPNKLRNILFRLLSGACSVLMGARCQLTGGHSVQGSEMALGFACVGELNDSKILKKSNLRKGQKLILTKGLGTGILLAAEMRGMCKGEWMEEAIKSMLKLNEKAVEVALKSNATACTDVTGFGLMGHLREMVVASKVVVELDLDSIPLLQGAVELSDAGVRSSLFDDNMKLSDAVENIEAKSQKIFPILFDPQTSGGLLFGVPPENADSCLEELQKCGFGEAACIGTVTTMQSESESRPVTIK